MKKHILTIIIALLSALTVALGCYYYFFIKDNSPKENSTIIVPANSSNNNSSNTSSNSNSSNQNSSINSNNSSNTTETLESLKNRTPDTINEPTVINGILLANKKHPLPRNYNPGENSTARQAVNKLISDGQAQGLDISNSTSGFRSFDTQAALYNNYVAEHGKQQADTFSARPGYSEHQTGLVFDLIDNSGQLLGASGTSSDSKKAASWLASNAHNYGFIIRYKEEFVQITGYMAESWHIRYVGKDVAKILYEKNMPLEEYLNALGGNYINE